MGTEKFVRELSLLSVLPVGPRSRGLLPEGDVSMYCVLQVSLGAVPGAISYAAGVRVRFGWLTVTGAVPTPGTDPPPLQVKR